MAAAGAASLAKQQEELEKKAAELQRKELDLQNLAAGRGLPLSGETDQSCIWLQTSGQEKAFCFTLKP